MLITSPASHVYAANAADAAAVAAHLENIAAYLNRMAARTVALPAADLQEFLRLKPRGEMDDEFGAHASLGNALNAAHTIVEAMTGIAISEVDTTPVPQKVAAAGKAISVDSNGNYLVTELAPPAETPAEDPA